MKFGGASLSSPKKIKNTAKIILKRKKIFSKIVVVVSAMGDMTDKLLKLAKKISKTPPPREQDMLITVGERISMSLLAMALLEMKLKAISFTGSQSGIITTNDHFNASHRLAVGTVMRNIWLFSKKKISPKYEVADCPVLSPSTITAITSI